MSVYIRDMEIPPVGRVLMVFPSGRVLEVSSDKIQDAYKGAEAVELPPHGRLIDADALIVRMKKAEEAQPEIADVYWDEIKTVKMWLATEPTVIEAKVDR